jgi:hypothetical protein
MSEYRWKGKDVDDLTLEEARETVKHLIRNGYRVITDEPCIDWLGTRYRCGQWTMIEFTWVAQVLVLLIVTSFICLMAALGVKWLTN